MEKIANKKIEIFSGTGGVGKTTLASARAINLASSGKSILLITIDPAKRLKEVLGIKDEQAGEVISIKDPLKQQDDFTLDIQLMSPDKTIERISKRSHSSQITSNRIMKILSRPYGGLNEILAIVELQLNFNKNQYDTIVLDTPPGGHFLDFLESVNKIRTFFDQSFIEIFQYLGKKVETNKAASVGKRFVTMVVSSGAKKLLGYLKNVTGEKFVDDFLGAIQSIYSCKDVFLDALSMQEQLKDSHNCNWFLVTSADQHKANEAIELQTKAQAILNDQSYIILNKCLTQEIANWHPQAGTLEAALRDSFEQKEKKIKDLMKDKYKNILEFSEILKVSPLDHVKELNKQWQRFI